MPGAGDMAGGEFLAGADVDQMRAIQPGRQLGGRDDETRIGVALVGHDGSVLGPSWFGHGGHSVLKTKGKTPVPAPARVHCLFTEAVP